MAFWSNGACHVLFSVFDNLFSDGMNFIKVPEVVLSRSLYLWKCVNYSHVCQFHPWFFITLLSSTQHHPSNVCMIRHDTRKNSFTIKKDIQYNHIMCVYILVTESIFYMSDDGSFEESPDVKRSYWQNGFIIIR